MNDEMNEVELSDAEINEIVTSIVKQSQYSFNKSHSVSYSTISYYQAFLKYYYPLQYWLAALKSSSGDLDKTSYYINCAKADNVEIMPVDILSSEDTYTIKNGKIYCGFQMAKGVKNDVYQLLKARSNRQFASIEDFISRLAKEEFKFGKRLCVPLVRIGVFSELCKNVKCLEAILCSSKKELANAVIPNENSDEYSEKELYQFEIEYLGLPFRFDYLKRYRDELTKSGAVSVMHYEQILEKDEIATRPFYGIVSNITKKTTKKSPPREYSIVTLADANKTMNLTIWPNEIEKYGHLLKRGELLVAYIAHNQYGNNLQRISNAIMKVELS